MSALPYDIDEAADQIDAAIFTGDTFFDKEARIELRRLMARWERGLKGFDEMCETPIP
jgi:hypothetical protein